MSYLFLVLFNREEDRPMKTTLEAHCQSVAWWHDQRRAIWSENAPRLGIIELASNVLFCCPTP